MNLFPKHIQLSLELYENRHILLLAQILLNLRLTYLLQ